MKNVAKILLPLMGLLLFSCSPESTIDENKNVENTTIENNLNSATSRISNTTISKIWNFNDLNEWTDATQVGYPNYWIENGNLHIFTNPNTWERTKVKTIASFGAGTYNWSVYIPEMGVGDMTSIAGFLYNNDTHELDFEIGYGSQNTRNFLGAQADDLIVYMTTQGNPFQSNQVKIKRNQWYGLTLQLTLNSKGSYVATWKINNLIAATAQLNYGKTTKFNVFCSVENLQFIGDHIPQNQNYALFDSVEYKAN